MSVYSTISGSSFRMNSGMNLRKNSVYIALGSNIRQPYVQIKNAILALNELPDTEVLVNSGYFKSKPMGPKDQPDYINAVVKIDTALSPFELLKNCQLIEQQQGRVKTRHWGERSIDLDILLYGDEKIDSDHLMLPHPGICLRDFVYLPLLKLNPDVSIPEKGLLRDIIATDIVTADNVVTDIEAADITPSDSVASAKNETSNYACQFAGNIE